MAKEKKTKDPLAPRATKVTKPAAKLKKPKAKLLEKNFKSAELITESDDEDMQDAPNAPADLIKRDATVLEKKKKNQTAPKVSEPAIVVNGSKAKQSETNDSSSSEEDDSLEIAKKEASRKRIEQLAQADDSDSSDQSSDDDEGDHRENKAAHAASTTVNGTGGKASEDDSEEEESDSEFETSSEPKSVAKPVSNGTTAMKSDTSESEEGDEKEKEDEEEEEEEEKVAQPPVKKSSNIITPVAQSLSSRQAPAKTSNGRLDNAIEDSQLRPTTKFKAPSGFRVVHDEPTSKLTVDLFNSKNTEDKEIWYISAPASLPITALKEVAIEKFAKQQPIMTYDGAEYALVSDPAAREATRVLLPDKKQKGYKVLPTPVNHVLQFQRVINLQTTSKRGLPKSSSQVLPDTTSATKPKKAQPKGMKMRFRPSGFGDGDLGVIGISDDEDVPAPASFRQPPSLLHDQPSSAKREELDEAAIQEKTEKKKKKKKDKHGVTVGIDIVPGEVTVDVDTSGGNKNGFVEGEPGEKKKDKKKKDKKRKQLAVDEPDVPMQDAPAGTEVAAPELIKEEKEKKKARKGQADEDMPVDNGNEMPAEAATELPEKKKKKKDKKAKKNEIEASEA